MVVNETQPSRMMSTGGDGSVRLWDVNNMVKDLRSHKLTHPNAMMESPAYKEALGQCFRNHNHIVTKDRLKTSMYACDAVWSPVGQDCIVALPDPDKFRLVCRGQRIVVVACRGRSGERWIAPRVMTSGICGKELCLSYFYIIYFSFSLVQIQIRPSQWPKNKVKGIKTAHTKSVNCVDYIRNTSRPSVVCGADDCQVHIIFLPNGQVTADWKMVHKQHTAPVTAVKSSRKEGKLWKP